MKALAARGKVRAIASAFIGAHELGIQDLGGMCAAVISLSSSQFCKSMTTHAEHRIWQDVYHAHTAGGDGVYLKLTVVDDVLIVPLKEL